MFDKLRNELEATRQLFYTHTGAHKGVFSLRGFAGVGDGEFDSQDTETACSTEQEV